MMVVHFVLVVVAHWLVVVVVVVEGGGLNGRIRIELPACYHLNLDIF